MPLTAAWSRRPEVTRSGRWRLSLPLGDGEGRLGLGEAGGPDDHGLAVLNLDQGGHRVDVLAGIVEPDGVLGQDMVGEIGLGDGVTDLVPIRGGGALERVPQDE